MAPAGEQRTTGHGGAELMGGEGKKRRTLKELERLLAEADADEALLRELEQDPRKGAARLLESHLRKKAAREREVERLERLYRCVEGILPDGLRVSTFPVGGVDEAGRGPLAGPVVAACVILPAHPRIEGLDDSKKLSAKARERLFETITRIATGIGIAVVSAVEIDRMNIMHAALEAMRRAVEACGPRRPAFVITDGDRVPRLDGTGVKAVVDGDALCAPVAAASIVAKVTRDRLMMELHEKWPVYGFASNKGYGTAGHMQALRRHGVCEEHRLSFAPVFEAALPSAELFERLMERAGDHESLDRAARLVKEHLDVLTSQDLERLRACYSRARRRIEGGDEGA